MLRLSILLALAVGAYSHLCLINPHQRGSAASINKPGADDCGLTTGPCGGRHGGQPMVAVPSGETVNITFQKNLNHFNAEKPGHFAFAFGTEQKLEAIGMTPDTNTSSPWLYEFPIDVPKVEKRETGVLQVTYVTSNPNAPAVFYQCADVEIIP
ncbi:uncharacterized protein LOC135823061 [Sycon ciliatum]|uniref:uncharacterized protein LOC135823061 n=1 Tax=Sycon ciliatum TaxID=27933 RepID=UPI0020AA2218|eukprot:scpid69502/ scgid7241/ 